MNEPYDTSLRGWERREPKDVVDKVHERQAHQLFYQAWVHNLGSIIVGSLATIAVWDTLDHADLLIWLGIFISVFVVRWVIAMQFGRENPKGAAIEKWARIQRGTIIAGALVYGAPIVFLWPAGSPPEQMVWIISITAITSAAVARYSVLKFADLPFVFIAYVPVLVRLVMQDGLSYTILGSLGILYFFILLHIGRAMYTTNLENLLSGVKNEQLSNRLAGKIDKVRQLNQKLALEMEERERAFGIVREREQELERARRMEAIGILSAGVAHEINSPLQFIGSNLSFLADGLGSMQSFTENISSFMEQMKSGDDVEMLRNHIKSKREESDIDFFLEEMMKARAEAEEGIERIKKIINAMELYTDSESSAATEVNMNELIKSTVLLTENLWQGCCSLTTEYQENLPKVSCNISQINQVIMSVLMNAVQAVKDKKTAKAFDGEIKVSTCRSDGKLSICIADNGIGIPEAIRHRVFEDFFTTREVGEGSGQGLSYSYRIVKNHGGSIRFESEENVGTTFFIELPEV